MRQLFILISLLLATNLHAQVKNLVFEGGGIRGIAYCGAIKVLEENKLLENVERVGGTSAGAITALMLSLGYTGEEITKLINTTPFKRFNDGNFLFFGGIHRLKRFYGWYKGRAFENWLDQIIESKAGNADISFKDLHARGFKELFITGTSLDQQKLFVFSREQYPHMRVKDAVRISMSIPLYFEAVFMNDNGTVIQRPKNKEGLHVMVDGGFIANFPIRIFDSTKYFDTSKPNQFAVNTQTIGFRIDRAGQIKNDSLGLGLAEFPIKKFNDYLGAFYNIISENLNRTDLTEKDWARTISINDGDIGPRIRKLSAKKLQLLIQNGNEAATKYFAKTVLISN